MNEIDLLLPSIELTRSEAEEVVTLFKTPSIQKYLKSLALADTKELLGLSSNGKTDAAIAEAHATTRGKLSVLSTLLSIPVLNKEKE